MPFIEYQTTHGRGFVLAREDWAYCGLVRCGWRASFAAGLNLFCFGYAIGYHFVESATGSANGNFVGLGADLAV